MSHEVEISRLQKPEEAQEGFCCMAEVPTPWPAALGMCRAWVSQNLGRHVEGYHLRLAGGPVVGQLYFAPSEQALIPYEIEPGVAVMYCEWIQSRHQGQDLGRRLFDTFRIDQQGQGCKGILVEATDRDERMHYHHFLSRGFRPLHEAGRRKLLYLALNQPNIDARPISPAALPGRPRGVTGQAPVEIVILNGYLCPMESATQLTLLEVASEFGEQVVVRQEPLSPATLRQYGAADGIFINGRPALAGATGEDEIRQAIRAEL